MDNTKEKAGQFVIFPECPKKFRFTSTCKSCNEVNTTSECVKCLQLFCDKCIALTPRGASCADCYPALHPEALFTTAYNFLTKVH